LCGSLKNTIFILEMIFILRNEKINYKLKEGIRTITQKT
jgi:uncharacterized membrane protein